MRMKLKERQRMKLNLNGSHDVREWRQRTSAILFVKSGGSKPPPQTVMEPFKLTTYNVHGFPWTAPPIHDIVAWIVSHSDIVALQEIWCQHAEWSAAFAAHGWTFARPAREAHIAAVFGSGLATAWRSSRWQLTDSRFYPYLDATGLDHLVAKGWFRVELQQRTAATPSLRLINTHMQADYDVFSREFRHITEDIRRRQVAQMLAVERALPPMPTLVTGDMNTDNCWFPGGWLLPAHMTAPPITFPSTAESLDHCTALGSAAWTVEEFSVSHIDLSDHYPVVWLLRLRSPTTSSQPRSLSVLAGSGARTHVVSEAATLVGAPAASLPQYPPRRSPSYE